MPWVTREFVQPALARLFTLCIVAILLGGGVAYAGYALFSSHVIQGWQPTFPAWACAIPSVILVTLGSILSLVGACLGTYSLWLLARIR